MWRSQYCVGITIFNINLIVCIIQHLRAHTGLASLITCHTEDPSLISFQSTAPIFALSEVITHYVVSQESLSQHDVDGAKCVINLRIQPWKTVALHERSSFFVHFVAVSCYQSSGITYFEVLWTTISWQEIFISITKSLTPFELLDRSYVLCKLNDQKYSRNDCRHAK